MAYEVSANLAALLAKERDSAHASTAVLAQLESDLIDLARRKAESRSAITRRIENTSLGPQDTSRNVLQSLVSGQGPSVVVDDDKRSSKSLRSAAEGTDLNMPSDFVPPGRKEYSSISKRKFRASKTRKSYPVQKSLTPHFAGLEFTHRSDADWLGVSTSKASYIRR